MNNYEYKDYVEVMTKSVERDMDFLRGAVKTSRQMEINEIIQESIRKLQTIINY